MKDDKLYLTHISECIDRIEQYVSSGREEFSNSTLIQDAVLRNLQVLAESTQRLSEQLRDEYSEVDWRRIAGFRNLLTHDYLGVDISYVWEIIIRELPNLKFTVESMLHDLGS